jgi:hypothetical protein
VKTIIDYWPFDQPKNCGIIVLRAVMDRQTIITFVSHDEDDHGWQFLDEETKKPNQVALVCLSSVVELDISVLEVADLEPGWIATRVDAKSSGVRRPNSNAS